MLRKYSYIALKIRRYHIISCNGILKYGSNKYNYEVEINKKRFLLV